MQTANAKRIIVKVGTSTLTHGPGRPDFRNIEMLARTLSDIKNRGYEIALVSSGAIGVGCGKLGFTEKPRELSLTQATAAVGQCELMHLYDKFFGEYGQTVAQILLTYDNIDNECSRKKLENTFSALFSLGVIPIVNENDSVSTIEISTGEEHVFGDNDTLSALVARLCRADLLILLSDIDGLYDSDPHKNPGARLISVVDGVDDRIRSAAGGTVNALATGGMSTKLRAAEIANGSGIDMVIMNGANPEKIYDMLSGIPVGTLFRAKKEVLNEAQ
ncbi:MAG: glutamate 5-kinase [Oscillospiraceae bacterium]|jgi:glutamate 5-kinase